jgi:hypothetical protein
MHLLSVCVMMTPLLLVVVVSSSSPFELEGVVVVVVVKGKAVAYHPTTTSRGLARICNANICRLKSFPMATSSPRSAWGTAKALVISTYTTIYV